MLKSPQLKALAVAALLCVGLSGDGQAADMGNHGAYLSAIEPLAADEVIGILSAPHLAGRHGAEDAGRCVARELARMAPAIGTLPDDAVVEMLAVPPPLWPMDVRAALKQEEVRSALERMKVRYLVYIFSMYSDAPSTGAPAMETEMDANIFDTQDVDAVGLLLVRTSDGRPAAEAELAACQEFARRLHAALTVAPQD